MFGETEISCWVGEMPLGAEYEEEEEPDLPAWCNKVADFMSFNQNLIGSEFYKFFLI